MIYFIVAGLVLLGLVLLGSGLLVYLVVSAVLTEVEKRPHV
jgi:hypothetical protein